MFDPLRWLLQSLGSPKDQKSEHVAIAVMFTTFLSFVITMTVVVTMGRPALQVQPIDFKPRYPHVLCPSSLAEQVLASPRSDTHSHSGAVINPDSPDDPSPVASDFSDRR